ncbi:hypothetical protein LguiA_004656 [Lonicera macranthoides]
MAPAGTLRKCMHVEVLVSASGEGLVIGLPPQRACVTSLPLSRTFICSTLRLRWEDYHVPLWRASPQVGGLPCASLGGLRLRWEDYHCASCGRTTIATLCLSGRAFDLLASCGRTTIAPHVGGLPLLHCASLGGLLIFIASCGRTTIAPHVGGLPLLHCASLGGLLILIASCGRTTIAPHVGGLPLLHCASLGGLLIFSPHVGGLPLRLMWEDYHCYTVPLWEGF